MTDERRVKVFRTSRGQAIRIPPEFELHGVEAVMRKEGARLIIEPPHRRSLLSVISKFKPLTEKFPVIKDRAPEPVKLASRTRRDRSTKA
jgi:antitoxin VapB